MIVRTYSKICVLALLLFQFTIAETIAANVYGARITGQGTYACREVGSKPVPGSPLSREGQVEDCSLSSAGSSVQGILHNRFGCNYVIDGTPAGQQVNIDIRWRFPPPGLHDPKNGKVFHYADYWTADTIGDGGEFYAYQFDEIWEIVPGIWTMEIWYQKRKLNECRFTVVTP